MVAVTDVARGLTRTLTTDEGGAYLAPNLIPGTYTIRATFTAIPRRRSVITAKAAVFTVATLAVGVTSCFAAFGLFQALLPVGDTLTANLADPGVARAVTGGGLYLGALGLLGLGLGVVLRSSAAAIATLFGMLFVPPILIELLPAGWQTTIGPYLPMHAGEQIFITGHQPGTLAPWTGYAVLCGYAVVALAIGYLLIRHRDA